MELIKGNFTKYIPEKDSILNEVLAAYDFPAEALHEPIVNFHNTEDRFAKYA